MKAAFIGCVDFSRAMLEHLLARASLNIVGVVTRQESTFNADFRSLAGLAQDRGIPTLTVQGNDQSSMVQMMARWAPDVVFCLGWSYLLSSELLRVPRLGVIGYHPALLPRNRGRHPIVWALALGLPATGSTFFIMDDGADSGDIIDQTRIPIGEHDDAALLYAKITETAIAQLDRITLDLLAGTLKRTPQDHSRATYWRKRGPCDGQVDWRMPALGIRNLVRALTRPYIGAHCVWHGHEIKLWRVESCAAVPPDIEPGRVLATEGRRLVVKCGDGAIVLVEHEFEELPIVGDCL